MNLRQNEIPFREARTGQASPNNSGMPVVHFTAQQFFLLAYTARGSRLNKNRCQLFHKSYFLVNVLRCFYSLLNAFFYGMTGVNAAVNSRNSNVICQVIK